MCVVGICPVSLVLASDATISSRPINRHDTIFVTLSTDPDVIRVCDVLRVLCLIIGGAAVIFTLRAMIVGVPGGVPGYGWRIRMLALALGLVASIGTEYDRIGDVLTLRLPLNLAFLICALLGVYRLPSVNRSLHDEWLQSQ